jgi:hypothetical protein
LFFDIPIFDIFSKRECATNNNHVIKYFLIIGFSRREKEKKALQTTIVTLLLITTSVVFACVVIDYAVNIMQNTLNTTNNPQLDRVKLIEGNLLNQTDAFSGSQPESPSATSP